MIMIIIQGYMIQVVSPSCLPLKGENAHLFCMNCSIMGELAPDIYGPNMASVNPTDLFSPTRFCRHRMVCCWRFVVFPISARHYISYNKILKNLPSTKPSKPHLWTHLLSAALPIIYPGLWKTIIGWNQLLWRPTQMMDTSILVFVKMIIAGYFIALSWFTIIFDTFWSNSVLCFFPFPMYSACSSGHTDGSKCQSFCYNDETSRILMCSFYRALHGTLIVE